MNRLLACQVLTVKGKEVIDPIALSIGKNLSDAVKEVLDALNVVLKILRVGVPYAESQEAKNTLETNDAVL